MTRSRPAAALLAALSVGLCAGTLTGCDAPPKAFDAHAAYAGRPPYSLQLLTSGMTSRMPRRLASHTA